jgi:hypothetical protein
VLRSRCRSKHTGPDKECRSCELPAEDDAAMARALAEGIIQKVAFDDEGKD